MIEAPTEVLHRNDGAQAWIMCGNKQLIESDEKLLQAYDAFTALQKIQADSISLEDFVRNEYAPGVL